MKNNKDWSRLLKMILVEDKKKSNTRKVLKKSKVTNTPLHRRQDVKKCVIQKRCQQVLDLPRLFQYLESTTFKREWIPLSFV